MAFKMNGTSLYKRTASKNGGTFMHTAKFGQNTSVGEMEAVKKHNKRHQGGETHAAGNKTGKYKDSVINKGEWSAKKEGGEGGPKKYKKAKPVAKKHHGGAMKKSNRDKFTKGTIPAHVKKAFPNLTQAEFDKDKQGYNKKAMAKLKAGDSKPPMAKHSKGDPSFKAYKNPGKYKVFNMGNKPTPVGKKYKK